MDDYSQRLRSSSLPFLEPPSPSVPPPRRKAPPCSPISRRKSSKGHCVSSTVATTVAPGAPNCTTILGHETEEPLILQDTHQRRKRTPVNQQFEPSLPPRQITPKDTNVKHSLFSPIVESRESPPREISPPSIDDFETWFSNRFSFGSYVGSDGVGTGPQPNFGQSTFPQTTPDQGRRPASNAESPYDQEQESIYKKKLEDVAMRELTRIVDSMPEGASVKSLHFIHRPKDPHSYPYTRNEANPSNHGAQHLNAEKLIKENVRRTAQPIRTLKNP